MAKRVEKKPANAACPAARVLKRETYWWKEKSLTPTTARDDEKTTTTIGSSEGKCTA